MSSWDFILSNIRFSYSSSSTFETCNYAYKMTYLDALPRENNFYGEFGTLIHECLEKYFTGEINDAFELSNFYEQQYPLVVKSMPPAYPAGMGEKYREQGLSFFDNFSFEKKKYDVLIVEDKIDFTVNGINYVAKPDLILKNKETGKLLLYDYKTATPFWKDKKTGKEVADTKKLNGYYQQMFIYTYALREIRNIAIDEIILWFVRLNKQVTVLCDPLKEKDAIVKLEEIISKIKAEEDFPYNNSNLYFCQNLCGVRALCEYR